MSQPLKTLALADIIHACRRESQVSYQTEPEEGACFELFRRAFEDNDELAWNALNVQYQRLLYVWLYRTSDQSLTAEDVDELAQEAWFKFWRAMQKREAPLQEAFGHVGAILSYLKQCAVTTFLDAKRKQQRESRLQQHLKQEAEENILLSPQNSRDDTYQQELLQTVRDWIAAEIDDPLEQLVISASFEYGLKPTQIVAKYPDKFSDTRDIQRIKERVIKRARRALIG